MPVPNKPSGVQKGKPEHKVLVSGSIQAYPPPEVEKRHNAERKEDASTRDAERTVDLGRESHKVWLERLTLLAVVIYAGITFWQGTLTRESINNNSQQFQIEQRPYVWYLEHMLPEDTHIVKGEQMRINFDWVNYGRTPALRSGGVGKIFCGSEAAQTVEKWFSVLGDATKPIVASSGPDRAFIIPPAIVTDPKNPLAFSSIRTDDILTQDQVDYILNTENACFVGVRTQYFDAYGTRYWSDICLSRQINGVLAHCDSHNEMH